MRITVFGASGKVGRLVTKEALARGHLVTVFVHQHTPFDASEKLAVVKGDVHSIYEVAAAIQGADAVISTLGSWGTRNKDVLSRGIRNIVDTMEAENVERIVSLTGTDARMKGEAIGFLNRISHFLIQHSPGKKILRDAERHISILEASSLDWMIIRSSIMNNRGVTRYTLTSRRPAPWATVNRKAVARCMVDQIETATFIRKAPFIVR